MAAQCRFEVNAGISDPGAYCWSEDHNQYKNHIYPKPNRLDDLEFSARKVTVLPNLSMEWSFDPHPFQKGFLKHFGLVGQVICSSAMTYSHDLMTDTYKYSSTAHKTDLLIGTRFTHYDTPRYRLYSQLLMGYSIYDNSGYWESNVYMNDLHHFCYQMGYISAEFEPCRNNHLTLLAEFGFGSESALDDRVPIATGIRIGIGYRF